MKKIQLLSSVLAALLPTVSQANSLTISGISSGGFMASQMAVIYSDQFSGVATVAGGVFYCAQNTYQQNLKNYGSTAFFAFGVSDDMVQAGTHIFSFQNGQQTQIPDMSHAMEPLPSNPTYQAVGVCMGHPEKILSSSQQNDGSFGPMNLDYVKMMESHHLISPVKNITQQKILIYQGDQDSVVRPAMAGKLQEFYSRMGVPSSSIKMVKVQGGAHNFPTDRDDGIACDSQDVPYVSSCKRDLAGDILKHLLGRNLNRTKNNLAHLYRVQQVAAPKSVASYGYLYANDFCLNNPGQCDLHVALHGCEMADAFDNNFEKLYESKIQMTKILQVSDYEMNARTPRMGAQIFAQKSGYAEYAEDPTNRLMVYFPQTQITSDNYPGNPKGCWDWYGWTNAMYATNQGPEPMWMIKQIRKVRQNPKALILQNNEDN